MEELNDRWRHQVYRLPKGIVLEAGEMGGGWLDMNKEEKRNIFLKRVTMARIGTEWERIQCVSEIMDVHG